MSTNLDSLNPKDLELSSYHFDLPAELIAQRPEISSRLLVYNISTDEVIHDYFANIGEYLPKESLLVFNQTKVFPSRLIGRKDSGGKAELFLLSTNPFGGVYPCLIKTRGKKNLADLFYFTDNVIAKILRIESDGTFGVSFSLENPQALRNFLDKNAKIPIPPYIRNGESDEEDRLSYQTLFAKEEGSVAAPTAGLHFKNGLIEKLEGQNIQTAYVTLHVGLGTFRPVKVDHIRDHQMHKEDYFFDQKNDQKIKNARANNRKIFAVGTTSLRVLESSFQKNLESNTIYSTDIFLYPGKDIKSIDGLITNFHLPQSTLLMLVSSLIGRQKTLEIYALAIKEKYRFFSYGDGMLIIK